MGFACGADDYVTKPFEPEYLRASYYLMLVNLYGKPYTPSTAASEPSVPIKLSPNVENRLGIDVLLQLIAHKMDTEVIGVIGLKA